LLFGTHKLNEVAKVIMNAFLEGFQSAAKLIASSSYFAVINFILTILAIALAWVFYRKSKKRTCLQCRILGYTLVENLEAKFPRLSVLYGDERLPNFSVSQIAFRNTGNTVIRPSDVAPQDPIRFLCAGPGEILEAEVAYPKSSPNNFSLAKSLDGSVRLSFDYLNPNDRCIVRIYHTAAGEKGLIVSGSVAGQMKPLTDASQGRTFAFIMGYARLAIDPKLKWVRVLIDLVVGVSLLAYAFLADPNPITWIVSLALGVYTLFSAVRRAAKGKSVPEDVAASQLEHTIDAAMRMVSSSLRESLRHGKGIEGNSEPVVSVDAEKARPN